jgi:hypothetical protein
MIACSTTHSIIKFPTICLTGCYRVAHNHLTSTTTTSVSASIPPSALSTTAKPPATDNAASIAAKTPVLLTVTNGALNSAALAHLDTNRDGKLSGSELGNLRAWADVNENGVADANEIKLLSQLGISEILAGDYGFYTRGNSRLASAGFSESSGPSDTPPTPAAQPAVLGLPAAATQSVPSSNYDTLRAKDEVYGRKGYTFIWTNLVKISIDQQYLIGTSGNDKFDANYYNKYAQIFDLEQLKNFLGGNIIRVRVKLLQKTKSGKERCVTQALIGDKTLNSTLYRYFVGIPQTLTPVI